MIRKTKSNKSCLLILLLFAFKVTYSFSQSTPTITIKQNLPIGSPSSLCGVAYGNNKYVTAGSYSPNPGLVYISDDGNNWTKVIDSDIPSTSTFKGVAFGNGIFVLVGDGGLILSSTDGLDWTQRTSGVTANFNKLIFVGSKFYAVGASRTLVSSSDGINWSQVSFNVGSASDDLGSITFGNSLFVIGTRGSNGGSNVYKSSTATSGSWTSQTVSASLSINRIQYLKDRFYIFTASSDIFTSANGSSWANSTSSMVATLPNSTTQTLASPNQIFHGIYDGTKIYLFGSSQYHGGYGSVFSTSDGTNFTLQNRTTTIVAQHSDYVNGKYFQTGNEGLCVSIDGINYVYPGGGYAGITTDGTNTVVVGSTSSSEAVMISFTDLNTISNNTSAIYSPLQGVGYLNNRFIAVGNSGTILSSNDGTAWTKQTGADSDPLRSVAYGNGKYVAVGAQGKIINSTNGTSWTSIQKDGASGSNFYSVRYLNGYFVAVGGGTGNTGAARIAYSTDGQTWTEINPGITGHFHDIVYNGSKYLLVGRLNSATVSSREFFSTTTTDITSNTFTSNVTLPTTNTGGQKLGVTGFGSVAYSNGHFVAVSNQIETPFNPYILESSNGTSWTPYSVDASSRLRSVTASGNNFYIAGTSSALIKFSYEATNTNATVTTASATAISPSSATLGGNVTIDGGTAVTERGIVWSTSTNPTTGDNKVNIGTGTGTFSQNITGLPEGTVIYVRGYAINSVGTAYGNEISFSTCPAAPIITPPGSLVICSPSTLTLTASGCAGTVKWSDNSTGTSITLSGVGTYSLSAVCIINGCMSNASSTVTGLEIKSNTVPSISINPLLICAGTNQTLTALPVNEGLNPKYFWYKNNIVQYISAFVNKTTSQGLVGNTVYDVFFDNNGKIYVATSVGLSISSDGGNTFSNKTTANGLGNNTVRGVHVTSDGKIYVATLGGLSISNDGGNTFTNKTTASGLGDNNVYEIFVATNGKIYAATNGGLSISTDGGTSFINKNTTNGLGSNTVYAIAIGADNKIYLATSGGGVGISSDAGNTFTNKTTINGLGHNTVRSIYLAPDNKLYAATSGGLSISTDGGNTFNNKNTSNGLTVNSVLGVTSGADGRIYVATQGGGIGISSDGGNSFTNKTIADGLGNNNVWGVYISPDNKLYSATLGGGLSIASIINGNSYAANGISTSDTYKVVLFPSAEMCSNPASVQASISASSTPAPTVSAPANLSVYWPDTLTLTASGCAGTITWSNNTTGTSVTLSAVGTYTLSATCTANGCTSSASTAITGLEIKQSLTPIIGTPVLSASSICAGSNLTITFEVSGPFGTGNQFSMLLSDTTGSFTNPTTIGTSSSSGTITYNVPIAIKGSTAYKIKIVSSNPVVESPEVSLKVHANNKIISATENLTGNNTIKAVNSIQAGNKFITPTNTLFKAGNSILLTAGFETNGVFVAEIGSCSE